MSIICPTVLAPTVEEYRDQLSAIEPFATRIQIDLGDGIFTTRSIAAAEVWWPTTMTPDIHLMHKKPLSALRSLVALRPNMVILHAEADELQESIDYLRAHTIRVGIALQQKTSVESVAELLPRCDHALIFSGSLGSFGGRADLSLLGKVPDIRALNRTIETGWDGGANADNIVQLAQGGIDVINVGGAIQKANHPENAYRALVRQLLTLTDA